MSAPPRPGRLAPYALALLLIVGLIAVAIVLRGRQRDVQVGTTAVPPSAGEVVAGPVRTRRDTARPARPASAGFGGCPAEGDGGDRELNRLKNRVDSASRWDPMSIESVLELPWPAGVEGTNRRTWSRRERADVERWEGKPVAVIGYLAGARQSGPESTNCHGDVATMRDWHVWLAPSAGSDRRRSVVVEPTPAIRARHPKWTLDGLGVVRQRGARVRISGWLMLDPEHPDQIGKTRGTIWEIHPVLGIEVEAGERWVPLDEYSVASRKRKRR